MTYLSIPAVHPRRRPILKTRIAHAIALMRQRRDLANLSDEALLDIGVSRKAAKIEAKRPFWDAPTTRKL